MDRCHRRLLPAVAGPAGERQMTTIGFRRRDPGRLAYRLIGAAAALGIVLALTRLSTGDSHHPGGRRAARGYRRRRPAAGWRREPGPAASRPARGLLGEARRRRRVVPGSHQPRRRVSRPLAGHRRPGRPAAGCHGALDEAAETAPYPDRVIVRRAMVAFALHDFVGARRRADDVLQQSPDDLAALGVAGDARLETGDIAGARERYDAWRSWPPRRLRGAAWAGWPS